jgi:hypothetical protein
VCTKSLGVDGRKRVISDMGEGEAYEKISSTAKLVAHIRSFTDIPFTKEIAAKRSRDRLSNTNRQKRGIHDSVCFQFGGTLQNY